MTRELQVLPAQKALLRSESRIVAFVGGYGSGKTRGAVYKALQLGLRNAPVPGIFVEPTYVLIQDAAIPSFKQVFDELGIPYRYRANDHVMNVAGKFDILFRSGDQPDRIVGSNLGWGIIDEPALQAEEVAKRVLARIRDARAPLRQLALTGTPEGLNWFYEWCKGGDIEVIRAKTRDNVFNPVEYIAALEAQYTPEEIQAYCNGEFVSFDGSWFRNVPVTKEHAIFFDEVRVFKQPSECSHQLVMGVDTGGGLGRDGSAFALVDKRDHSLVASWKDNTVTIDHMVGLIAKVVAMYTPVIKSPLEMVPDMTGNAPIVVVEKNGIGIATIQQLRARKVSCVEQNTTESARYEGMLLVRQKVAEGLLFGPPELKEEAELLVTKDGKFVGPKDLSMAYGFAARFIQTNPYKAPPDPVHANVLNLRNRLKKRSRIW